MVAAPLGGSSEEMKVIASGTNFGMKWIKSSKFRPFEVSIESDFWLLPIP